MAILIEHFDEDSINREEIHFDKNKKTGPKLFTYLKIKYNNVIKKMTTRSNAYKDDDGGTGGTVAPPKEKVISKNR